MSWRALARGPALLTIERAVDDASRLLLEGRSKMDTVIAKGDRDFATALDLEAERLIRTRLERLSADIPFLGEEWGGPAPSMRASGGPTTRSYSALPGKRRQAERPL